MEAPVHLINGALQDQSNRNKSYILALGTTSRQKQQQQQIVDLSTGAPLRHQQRQKSNILALGALLQH